MNHKLGVYFAPQHDLPSTWKYIQRLQPPVVRLLLRGTDTVLVSRVHQAALDARIALRWWDIDDGGEGNKAEKLRNPEASGAADAREVLARVQWMEREAEDRGYSFPPRAMLLANTMNEPPIWEPGIRARTVANNRSFIAGLIPHGIPVAAGCINTGHPAEWPPVWDWFAPVVDILKMSPGSCLELHEYWQFEGPNYVWTDAEGKVRKDWGALAGRYQRCPFDVPILIGECGADGRLYDRKPAHTGWFGNMPAATYAMHLRWYHEQIAYNKRIIAALPFLTDYQDDHWATFDTTTAHEEILSWATTFRMPIIPPTETNGEQKTHLPLVGNGPTPPDPPAPIGRDQSDSGPVSPVGQDNWERSLAWVARWEGEYQNVANDVGNWTGGAVGVGENKGTKWGISAASYPQLDIKNLSREEAHAIFKRDYWIPSGASQLPWPACLVVFDTSILHGVGTALGWQIEVGTSAFAFAAKRLRVYTRLSNWDYWGKAWVQRVADLLEECAR